MSRRHFPKSSVSLNDSHPLHDPDEPLAFLKGVGRALVEERRRLPQRGICRLCVETETESGVDCDSRNVLKAQPVAAAWEAVRRG